MAIVSPLQPANAGRVLTIGGFPSGCACRPLISKRPPFYRLDGIRREAAAAAPVSTGWRGEGACATRDPRCTPRSGGIPRASPPRGVHWRGVLNGRRLAALDPVPASSPGTYIGRYRPLYHAIYCGRAVHTPIPGVAIPTVLADRKARARSPGGCPTRLRRSLGRSPQGRDCPLRGACHLQHRRAASSPVTTLCSCSCGSGSSTSKRPMSSGSGRAANSEHRSAIRPHYAKALGSISRIDACSDGLSDPPLRPSVQ